MCYSANVGLLCENKDEFWTCIPKHHNEWIYFKKCHFEVNKFCLPCQKNASPATKKKEYSLVLRLDVGIHLYLCFLFLFVLLRLGIALNPAINFNTLFLRRGSSKHRQRNEVVKQGFVRSK